MSNTRIFLAFLVAALYASSTHSAPTIKLCEPEFSTFLEVFGGAYTASSVLVNTPDQYECPEIGASQAIEERAEWMLVDTRPQREFEAIHIPGSVNTKADTARELSHLKSRQILLINKGSRHAATKRLCQDLKAKGFDHVSILEEGLNGWIASGAPYNGNVTGLRELFFLTEREVSYLLHHKQIQILYIEAARSQQTANTLLYQHANAFSTDQTSDILLKLNQLESARHLPVLMVSDGARNSDIIDRYMTAKNANVYFLANGASGLDQYYHDWKNSLVSKNASDSVGASCL